MYIRILSALVFTLLAALAGNVEAQGVETNGDADHVRQLLEDLASPVFSTRQKAASEVMDLDASAVPVLEGELESVPASVATQLRVLIPRLRKRLFDDRITAFDENPAVENAVGLPEWDRFSTMAGDNKDAVPVYQEILKAERDLFAAKMFFAPDFSEQLRNRSTAFAASCDGRADREFPIANAAALMLLASNESPRLIGTTSTNISKALDDPRFGELIENGVHAETLRAIAEAWIQRPGIAVDRPLLFSMKHKLAAGRNVALRTLARPAQNQSTYYALFCLGVLNQPEDIATVEGMFTSEKTLWPPRGQSAKKLLPGKDVESTYAVQTRDVALAVAVHMRGEQPRDFGMTVIRSELHLFTVDSLGFDDDEQRRAAIEKYNAAFHAAVGQ